MHGILAFSGSHLSLLSNDGKSDLALAHRQQAIAGLEEAFTRWPPKAEEAHVMLATSYLLAFQSVFMTDGSLDHVLSLRGCALLSQGILSNQLEGTFSVKRTQPDRSLDLRFGKLPHLDQGLARDALSSLASFAHLLVAPNAHDIERALFAQLVESIRPLLLPNELDTPETESRSDLPDCAPDTESTSFWIPFPPNHVRDPLLFPNYLTVSYQELLRTDIRGITSVPPDHTPNPQRAFDALMSSVLIFAVWPQEDVLHLYDSSNKLGAVVMAHCYAIRCVITPLTAPAAAKVTSFL
jgi:hypothetical protein